MAPDFDKIQAGMTNGLQKTTKTKKEEQTSKLQEEVGISFKNVERKDLGTGVAGKSSVKMDNFDTDMARFQNYPMVVEAANAYVDSLLAKGYSLEEAVSAVHNELGIK